MTDWNKNAWRKQAANTLDVKRRHFLKGMAGIGGIAAMSRFGGPLSALDGGATSLDFSRTPEAPLSVLPPQFKPRARRVIYLHMAGAPSQLELFDYKPVLKRFDGQDTPHSFLEGNNFAFITGVPKLLGPNFEFKQHGDSGAWISDRLPHLAEHADELCFIKSMHTDQFNHAPAQLLMQTGSTQLGHASLGSWATYGLGSENQNLPGYIVMLSGGTEPFGGKAMWGSGYLPSVYQGIRCRPEGDPVLYLSNPEGVSRQARRKVLDALGSLNEESYARYNDPDTLTRIAQYEMAFRMQTEATDAFDISLESEVMRERYGVTAGGGSFANNCLIARRLVERGVRFVELFDTQWDSHGSSRQESLHHGFVDKCRQVDKPIAALLSDLKASGLLEDTLVVWASEFGRTPMRENRGGATDAFVGRDHNPHAYTIWMAGGGVKAGHTHGETDEMGYKAARDPVSIHDFHATLLYLLGYGHESLNYRFQGLDQRLTGIHHARVVSQVLA